ncbi:type II secretion system protein GspM [Thiovibrio sp. JS02]
MKLLVDFFNRFERRHLLVGVAAVLLLLNLGRWGVDYVNARQEELAGRMDLLAQYQEAVRRLPEIERRVSLKSRRQQQLEALLFAGDSEEKIASSMQISLQSQISKAGLEPEFIQPVRSGGGQAIDRQGHGDLAIKIRMSGSLNDFAKFLQILYASNQLFLIENYTIKPFSQGELKIFMEVRGYYKISKTGDKPA